MYLILLNILKLIDKWLLLKFKIENVNVSFENMAIHINLFLWS